MELPNRSEIDAEAARMLGKLTEKHKRELRRLLGNPPLWENVPATFWRRVKRELEEEAAALFLLVFMESARFHGLDRETAEVSGRAWAVSQAATVATSYVETTQARLSGHTQRWLGTMLVEGKPITDEEIDDSLDSLSGSDRAARVAADVVTRAQTFGGEQAMEAMGLSSEDDWWKTNPGLSSSGPCQLCDSMHGMSREEWSEIAPNGPGAHPGCVCEIVYVALENRVAA